MPRSLIYGSLGIFLEMVNIVPVSTSMRNNLVGVRCKNVMCQLVHNKNPCSMMIEVHSLEGVHYEP